MFPVTTYVYLISLLAFAIIVPVAVSLIYVKVKHEKFTTVLIGAAIFAVFALGLESVPKAILFQIPSPVSRFFLSNPWALTIAGALLAGLFEEMGRFLAFKVMLKRRTLKTTSIAYGLGHGLFEVMAILGIGAIQYFSFIFLIESGQWNTLLSQISVQAPDQWATYAAIPGMLKNLSMADFPLVVIERFGAVLFHVSASVIVFYGVRTPKKGWCVILAILLHTFLDIFAGLGQTGVITNVYVLEAIITGYGVIFAVLTYLLVYKKMPQDTAIN